MRAVGGRYTPHVLIGGPELRRVARRRLRAGVLADEAGLAGAPLVDGVVWATLRHVALVSERQAALTDVLTVPACTAHVGATVPIPAAPGPLAARLHMLPANPEHALQVPATHGVPATRLPRPHLDPTHTVVLVTELTPLTHAITVTQPLRGKDEAGQLCESLLQPPLPPRCIVFRQMN